MTKLKRLTQPEYQVLVFNYNIKLVLDLEIYQILAAFFKSL